MSVGRRGFLGRVAAALGVGSAARVAAAAAPVGREFTITKYDVAAREVTYGCDATMAKIEAGPRGPVANGFGARYFDGRPEPPPVSSRVRERRQAFEGRGSAVAIVPDGGELPVPRG
jgi:hypothetical protein